MAFVCTTSLFFSQAKKESLTCYDLTQVLKVEPTALYKPHIDASQSFRVNILKTTSTVQKYINNGKFHKVKKIGKGYRVQKLDYSRAWLVSKAYLSLERIASRFSKKYRWFLLYSNLYHENIGRSM